MEPSKYIEKLINLNRLDVTRNNNDKIKVQDQVLKKYKNINYIKKILYKNLAQPEFVDKNPDMRESLLSRMESTISMRSSTMSVFSGGPSNRESTMPTGSLYSINSQVRTSGKLKSLKLPSTPTREEIAEEHKPWMPMRLQKRHKPVKIYPRHKPPKAVILPFKHAAEVEYKTSYVETPGSTRFGIMKCLVKGKETPPIPDWLVKLPDSFLHNIRGIKQALKSIKNTNNPHEELDHITQIIRTKMKLTMITRREICGLLKKIPAAEDHDDGLSFGHFMFAMGNPQLATEKRIFISVPRNISCLTENPEDDEEILPELELEKPKFGKVTKKKKPEHMYHMQTLKGMHHYGALADYLYRFDTDDMDDDPETKAEKEKEKAEAEAKRIAYEKAVAMLREQIFFSGLFVTQMYDTTENVKKILQADYIPEPDKLVEFKDFDRVKNYSPGTKKRGVAAWDIPLTTRSKVSPYLASNPFCNARLEVTKPNGTEKNAKAAKYNTKYLHYILRAPPEGGRGPIRLTENKGRILKALRYLASKGDCLAMLPNVELLFNFVDADPETSTEVHISSSKKRKHAKTVKSVNSKAKCEAEHYRDYAWIKEEAEKLYITPKLPVNIKNVKGPLIPLTQSRKLRNDVKVIQKGQWATVGKHRTQYRSELWKKLDVLSVPSGGIRNNFVYSFSCLMPKFPKFETDVDNKNPWRA